MRRIVVLAFALLFIDNLQAQSLNITGTLSDNQAQTPLYNATVRLTSFTDPSFSRSALTDTAGRFQFANLAPDSFLLVASFIGYNEIRRQIRLDSTSINIDIAATSSSSSELATVVITANVSPVTQRGDTLQVSASQFKVNPDASAEDLIRKVPGITIENGQVKAQGENVQRVTIDGRELFGDDATAALRNLPAEIIDKIQIFDRLSDQAQVSGFDDGNTTKGINIITKANMRNGQFGRVLAGYGTDNRYQLGGNTTFLKENRRISLVGNFNNINQQNFSQQDLLGVTSNVQRGGGGGPRGGGGGGPRGGGNFGGGGSGNFLVGQQNGINKTNAFGINFSDIWGTKLTVTGSYLFNNTDNNTNQIANTQYITGSFLNNLDTTTARSQNFNHRVNLRLEYKIDSSSTLIITPNLSFQKNDNNRRVGTFTTFSPGNKFTDRINQNTSHSLRSGSNLNNNILYRRSFAKRGRSFSINLRTSYNNSDGETFVTTFQRRMDTSNIFSDTSSQRFTDQTNGSFQVSTNINYTEPLSEKSQIQFSYNPSFSKNLSDQQTYAYNTLEDKYSSFLENLSNKFENRTNSQNAGLSYRWGDRDRQLSFGVNYQNTNLKSDQIFPKHLSVDKSFSNFLPNAMFRYKLSARSNIRLFYRSNVNNPSVTQLQNVLDPTNAPYFTSGNPELEPQFMNIVSTQYTYTNTAKGLLLVGNIFYQSANNYITNATFMPLRDSVVNGQKLQFGDQLNKPVNLDGYSNLRSFVTFAVPLAFIKSNFNLNGGVSYAKIPGILNNVLSETRNLTYSAGTVIASNVSQYVDFTISYTANFNKVKNNIDETRNNDYFQHVAGLQMNLLSKTGWFFQNDLNNQYYSGLSQGFNQNYFLWNMGVGKKFLPGQKGELKLSVFDLLKQNRSISRNVLQNGSGIEDVSNVVLTQYFMMTFTYNLRNFGTAAQRAENRRENFHR